MSPAVAQLKYILNNLARLPLNIHSLRNLVGEIFRQANYERHPYEFRFPLLFRAACKTDEQWFNFPNGEVDVSRFHCPPDHVGALGRCNFEGQSVFYCSTENGVPIFEVRTKQDTKLALSHWTSQSSSMPVAFTGFAIGVERILRSEQVDSPVTELLLQDDFFRQSTPAHIKEIDAFIGDLFAMEAATKENPKVGVTNLYLFTSVIANILLENMMTEDGKKLDGFIYPSVQSKFTGQNVVLTSEFARHNLKLVAVSLYDVVEHNPATSYYSMKPLRALGNRSSDNSAVWRNVHPKHKDSRFVLSPDTPLVDILKNPILELEEE